MQYKNQVDELTDLLDVKASKIHGGLRQEDRFRAMDDFKSGKSRFLIATDVAGRGIDVDNVSLVINYDLPIEKRKLCASYRSYWTRWQKWESY